MARDVAATEKIRRALEARSRETEEMRRAVEERSCALEERRRELEAPPPCTEERRQGLDVMTSHREARQVRLNPKPPALSSALIPHGIAAGCNTPEP